MHLFFYPFVYNAIPYAGNNIDRNYIKEEDLSCNKPSSMSYQIFL